jgi:hypothetical protein
MVTSKVPAAGTEDSQFQLLQEYDHARKQIHSSSLGHQRDVVAMIFNWSA